MAESSMKEQERAELHLTIWGIANDLRGSVDGWDFKQYVLGMLFYRYISENLSAYVDREVRAAGNAGFDYAKLPDDEAESADLTAGLPTEIAARRKQYEYYRDKLLSFRRKGA